MRVTDLLRAAASCLALFSTLVTAEVMLLDGGSCKLYRSQGAIKPDTTFRWIGACKNGFAEGEGYFLREDNNRQNRTIVKLRMAAGRDGGPPETLYARFPGGNTLKMEIDNQGGAVPGPFPASQMPAWASSYLLSGETAHLESDVSAIRNQIAAQARYEEEARVRRQREEEEQAREGIERRRRENEEDERQARRYAQEQQEARDRQWTDMATSIVAGAAAMKRQQDEQNARREAERRRIEADNARYRQAQAEDGRRWAEQNQRMQQAAIERQRVEQERQRVEEARREEARRRPREQRVNLPKYTGCIRLEWGKNIPQNSDQWYTLHNTCANDLHVHWCDRPGCQRPSAMALIRGGGNTRSWLLKKNGVAVTVVAACQLENGGKTVNLDRDGNQCWSMVTMN